MGQEAIAAPAGIYPNVHAIEQSSKRVLREQLLLLARQWVRVPVPVLILCFYVAYLGWGYASMAIVLGWSACTVGILIARSILLVRLKRSEELAKRPEIWAARLTALAALSGVVSGSAALLFLNVLPPERQALLTMVMCCWVAGGIASSSCYPRAYYAFAVPLIVQLAAAWAQHADAGSSFILILLAAFFAVLIAFVRDNGRVVVESIRLQFANAELLDQKEQLIGLLRAAFEKAEAARAKAEEANRSKSQFLASASHDLRQPLHALSLLTALLTEMTEDARVREVGRNIGHSVQSLDRLFGALLDLSKLDAGVITPEPRDMDFAQFVEQLSAEYRSKAQEKGLHYAIDCEPLWLRADPILLERIVRNLLENAIRFTESGSVSLRARSAGRDALISVSDTGRGIPHSEHGRVFEEFYQLQNPSRDRSKGLGLGLSIVKRLVELLGYRIELESAPGQGATFSLTLPGAITQRADAHVEPTSAQMPDVRGLRVLVIEDDAEARQAMEMTLRRWGCEPLVAESLQQARELTRVAGDSTDIVLSDLRLGNGADGIAAIEALRAEFGPLPAALITGDIGGERLRELRASGLPVLHKPVKAETLRELLHGLARGSAAH